MKPIDTKRPRKLDLNAPLLTTRRTNLSAIASSIELSRSNSLYRSCERVPFLWEQSPGKPKDITNPGNVEEFKAFPLPKPPPIRWQEECHGIAGDVEDDDSENECGNDEEYEQGTDEDEAGYSDTIDLLSLVESLYTSSEKLGGNNCEDVGYECDIGDSNGSLSPNFMIQRFLPAATALAASSLSALAGDNEASNGACNDNKHLVRVYPNNNISSVKEGSCIPRVAGEAYNSSKACGLEMLFPWRVKHRLCGVKSPVRRVRPNIKPQFKPKE